MQVTRRRVSLGATVQAAIGTPRAHWSKRIPHVRQHPQEGEVYSVTATTHRPSPQQLVVQGMRTTGPSHPRSDWRWVIARRLRLEHHLLPSGEKTAEAERGLQLGPCAYFYVGRCEPEFSDYAIAYEDYDSFESEVSPFDSGGLWFGHVTTKATLVDEHDRMDFLRMNTLPHDAYGILFESWVSSAYSDRSEYVEGLRPASCYAGDVSIEEGADARSWTWELRVEKRFFPEVHLRPKALCISLPKLQQLSQWVIGEGSFAQNERSTLLSTIHDLHIDPAGLGSGFMMNDWLKETA